VIGIEALDQRTHLVDPGAQRGAGGVLVRSGVGIARLVHQLPGENGRLVHPAHTGEEVRAPQRVPHIVLVLLEAARAGLLVEESPSVRVPGGQALPGQPGVDPTVGLPEVLEDRDQPQVVVAGRLDHIVEEDELLLGVHALAGLKPLPLLVAEHPQPKYGHAVALELGHVRVDAGLVHVLLTGQPVEAHREHVIGVGPGDVVGPAVEAEPDAAAGDEAVAQVGRPCPRCCGDGQPGRESGHRNQQSLPTGTRHERPPWVTMTTIDGWCQPTITPGFRRTEALPACG
jgi:hypothetical protein